MQKSNFKWQLINDSIIESDKKALTDFINTPNQRFTNGSKVKEFEEKWSEWLGVKHSVFVNSGAMANYLMVALMKETKGYGEVIVPAIAWVSDISSLVNLGMKPIFVDIDISNFAMTLEGIKNAVTEKTKGIVLCHILGFNAISEQIVDFAKENDLFLIEDCCESHGITYKEKKAGTFGDVSNFSFYFGHHMTTIEGGMISTNSREIDRLAKMKRGHGLLRDSQDDKFIKSTIKKNKDLNNDFIFNTEGFNLRNNELSAVIGIQQLKRLNKNIEIRNRNHKLFLKHLRGDIFFKNFNLKGSSNYGLHLILKEKNIKLFKNILKLLNRKHIEHRLGSLGNQLRQPYLKKNENSNFYKLLKNTEHMHFFSVYIGNHQFLDKRKIIDLCKKLDRLVN